MNGQLEPQTSGNDWNDPSWGGSSQFLHLQKYWNHSAQPEPETEAQPRLPRQFLLALHREEVAVQNFALELAEVRRQYVSVNDRDVRDFFRTHRTAPQLLIEALPKLTEKFGVGRVLKLRTSSDEVGSQTLYALVMWPGDVAVVRAAFEQFDQEWWIENSHRASGAVSFTYELV
jgi:hypothetical protein